MLSWASDHRRHHKNIDEEADPYNIQKGFLWAHMGWLIFKAPNPEDFSNIPDLTADRMIRWQHDYYVPLAVTMGFGVPLAIGFAIGHPWGCLLWAGLVRTIVVHHSTFFVNSLAHTLGRRPYCVAVSARDSVINATFNVGLQLLGFLKGWIVAGFLTASEYGVWGLLVISLGKLLWLLQIGIDDKYIQQDHPDQEKAFHLAFTLQCMLAGS